MNLHQSVIFLVLSGMLSLSLSCALSENSEYGSVYKIPAENLDVARLIAQSSEVECEEPGSCPPQVGMVVAATENSVAWCTAFMISEQTAATNAHCIPKEIRTSGTACQDRVWISFPATNGYEKQIIPCDQITDVSFGAAYEEDRDANSEIKKDYAFITLREGTARGVLEISREGLGHHEVAKIHKINPDRTDFTRFRGTLQTVECSVDHEVFDGAENAKSSFFSLPACPIFGGNSGSPLVVDDQVRGVMYAVTRRAYDNSLFSTREYVALATNFACVQGPYPHDHKRTLSSACSVDLRIR